MNANALVEINGVEFDPRYSEIEFTLSEYDSETDPLNTSDNVRDINWHVIRNMSAELLERCFDLRVVLWFMRAELNLNGFSAFYNSITEIDRQYSTEGRIIFPQVDKALPPDSAHAAALSWLTTPSCLHELKNSRIFAEDSVILGDLINFRTADSEGKNLHFSQRVTLIGHADTYFSGKGLPTLHAQLTLALAALERVEHYANYHAEDYRLDCRHIRDYLQQIMITLDSLNQLELPVDTEGIADKVLDHDLNITAGSGHIRSRQEVILLLDQVLDYFQNYEPSHPAPILIRRSQKMIGMDFATIIEELLPESLVSLNQLSGK